MTLYQAKIELDPDCDMDLHITRRQTMSKKQEMQEIIVERDNGKDYKFQGRMLVDESFEDIIGQHDYYGIIQVYYVERAIFKDKEKGYVLVTRCYETKLAREHTAVTDAGLVINGIGMVIQLILAKFERNRVVPNWVMKAINTLKESDHNDKGGQYEVLKEYKGEE